MTMSFDRLAAEIVTQTGLLRTQVEGADPATPVPACPGWSLARLLRHLGEGHRYAATIVRTGTAISDQSLRDIPNDVAMDLDWLAEGARLLADALREAGPAARVWTPLPDGAPTPRFWARRFTHETLVHRADAVLAVGARFTAEPRVAADAIDEWMELGSMPQIFEYQPHQRELLGPDRTLAFHATDTATGWLVDLTGDHIAWRRPGDEKPAVTARGPLTDLLLLIYRRRPLSGLAIDVDGDADLLDFWLQRVAFG